MFHNKLDKEGNIIRNKTRLVVKGHCQKECIDYGETFSPVAKMVTIRVVVSLAVNNSWNLYQLDVNNATCMGILMKMFI